MGRVRAQLIPQQCNQAATPREFSRRILRFGFDGFPVGVA